MAKNFLTPINLNKNELQNAAVQNLASAPSTPVKGQLYFDSVGNVLYWWNGSGWIAAQGGAGAVPATTVTTQAFADAPVVGVGTLYSRDDHKHGMPAHDAAAHSAIPHSALSAPTADVAWGGFKITNLAAPSNGTDATNKTYVDNAVAGLAWKDSVRVASTANHARTGLSAIDGVTPIALDRVLLKNQTNVQENGIYLAASGAWSRASDADIDTEIAGMAVFVMEGTAGADTAWVCTANLPISVDTTPLPFVQFAGGGAVTAGAGLTQSGNTLDVGAGTGITVAADSVAVTPAGVTNALLATMPANTFKGNNTGGVAAPTDVTVAAMQTALAVPALPVTVANGGTGRATATTAYGLIAAGTTATGVQQTVAPGTSGHFLKSAGASALAGFAAIAQADVANLATDLAARTRKFAAANVGGATSQVVNHALGTRDVIVNVYRTLTPWDTIECDVERTDANNVTLRFAVAPSSNEYSVVVIG